MIPVLRHAQGHRQGRPDRAVVHRHHDGTRVLGREPDRLQHPGFVRRDPRQERSVAGHRLPDRLRAGAVARGLHQQEGQEPQRRQAVDGLHAVAEGPGHHRQPGRPGLGARRHPRRQRRRRHDQEAGRLAADPGQRNAAGLPGAEQAPGIHQAVARRGRQARRRRDASAVPAARVGRRPAAPARRHAPAGGAYPEHRISPCSHCAENGSPCRAAWWC